MLQGHKRISCPSTPLGTPAYGAVTGLTSIPLLDLSCNEPSKSVATPVIQPTKSDVWNFWIGPTQLEATCCACLQTQIKRHLFQCLKYDLALPLTVENLRPVCAGCHAIVCVNNISLQHLIRKISDNTLDD